jgi:hypothetical protein
MFYFFNIMDTLPKWSCVRMTYSVQVSDDVSSSSLDDSVTGLVLATFFMHRMDGRANSASATGSA